MKDLILDWAHDNRKALNDQIEDRTGQRPTEANPVTASMVGLTVKGVEVDYAVLIFEDKPVGFLVVDYAEPEVKVCYL